MPLSKDCLKVHKSRASPYPTREAAADYKPLLEDENEDIGLEKAYFWNLNAE